MSQKTGTRYRSKGSLADRYEVSERTIDRWRKEDKFPPPDLVLPSGSPRWSDDTITAHERASVSLQLRNAKRRPGWGGASCF